MRTDIIYSDHKDFFDILLGSNEQKNITGLRNLGMLLFEELPHRDRNAEVIISHLEEKVVRLNLAEFRQVVVSLYKKFQAHNIKQGDTVFLARFETNSELYTAILFYALASYGARVFLPMYVEQADLNDWNEKLSFNSIISPGREILSSSNRDRYKTGVDQLKDFAHTKNIPNLDTFLDLDIEGIFKSRKSLLSEDEKDLLQNVISEVPSSEIALLMTTSGTSGKSKIVAYEHVSFLINLSAWKISGLLDPDKLGGRSFTPLFAHTMGIRTFMNGLYSGQPITLINTDWFTEKPEAVQYFLNESRPEHITGGPAVFNLLLEMCRVFPRLKSTFRKNLRTLVSCGASLDKAIVDKLKDTFEIKVHNALGTTETQQVLSTLIGDISPDYLGKPFPGVSIGLKNTGVSGDYRLYIRSNYGASWIQDQENTHIKNRFIYLGDIVGVEGENIYFKRREKEDYFSDEFGVKVPIQNVLTNYKQVCENSTGIRLFPLKYTPGLSAIIFIDHDEAQLSTSLIKDFKQLMERINQNLYQTLAPLDFQHRTIKRFSLQDSRDVLNAKGLLSENKISQVHTDLIDRLTQDNISRLEITDLKDIREKDTAFTSFHNPYIGKMLDALQMDISYESAKGDYLYSTKGEKDKRILDLVGGYGTNLLGHNQEKLLEHAIDFLKSGKIPLSDQVSKQSNPGKLAEKLNEMISNSTGRNYYTLLGSTGSEVVEMAIHHAYLEWKKKFKELEQKQKIYFAHLDQVKFRKVWISNRKALEEASLAVITNRYAYHGNTTTARSLIGNKESRNKFSGLLSLVPIFIDDTRQNIAEQIEMGIEKSMVKLQVFSKKDGELSLENYKFSCVIAAILEPVLGEGGIREINPVLPKTLGSMDFPLIFDEIQSGLGRTGSFLASEGFKGDYYLFSKSLGGNIAKIAAVAIDRSRYLEEFGKLYVSTFSGGALASSIALKTLQIIAEENVCVIARTKGEEIRKKLDEVQRQFPEKIAGIQGKGLMIGIKFQKPKKDDFLRILQERKLMGYLISSWLLHHYQIRILPSLSAPNVLRVEPSIGIGKKDIEQLQAGIMEVAKLLKQENFYGLTRHLMQGDHYSDNKGHIPQYGYIGSDLESAGKDAVKVAFIAHFAYPTEELRMLSKSLTQASDTGLWSLFGKFATIMNLEPFVLNSRNLYKGKINLTTIVIPVDSATLEKFHRTEQKRKIIVNIQKAVDLAAKNGARYISLGGYNSILTRNGLSILEPEHARVLTGNTLTAVVGYHNFRNAILKILKNPEKLNIAVVGATGNIGKILALKLLNDPLVPISNLKLFGKNSARLKTLATEISSRRENKKININYSFQMRDLKECDAILVVVNTNDPIIGKNHIARDKPVIISDLSVPAAVSSELQDCSNVQLFPFGASIKLQEDPDVLVTSCSPRGTALCCIAEAFLNAFEEIEVDLKGEITYEGFQVVEALAEKHGFIRDMKSIKSYKSI